MPTKGPTLALVDYFQRGGIFMWPLLACSVIGLAAIIYKAYVLWVSGRGAEKLVAEVLAMVRAGDRAGAARRCSSSSTAVAAVLGTILTADRSDAAALRREAELAGNQQLASLEAALSTLSGVATVAPLLGFLGTVSGMIHAFDAVARFGLGNPEVVARGIAEALITTAAGLIIAIPCFAAYSYFGAQVNKLALSMETAGSELLKVATQEGVPSEA